MLTDVSVMLVVPARQGWVIYQKLDSLLIAIDAMETILAQHVRRSAMIARTDLKPTRKPHS